MRVIVTGGRGFNRHSVVYHALDNVNDERGPITAVITGDASGADHWAESWAWMNKIKHLKFAADWTGYGKKAGPIRNQVMIEEGRANLCLAFPGGRGTADCVRRARAAGIKVVEIK